MVALAGRAQRPVRSTLGGAPLSEHRIREVARVEAAPSTPTALADEVGPLKERLASLEAQLLEAERSLETAVGQANRAALAAEIEVIEARQLLNVSHDALWVVDGAFRILRVNEAMARLVGERPERLKGRRCSEWFSYGLCGTPDCPVTRLKDGGDLLEKDVEGVSAPGKHFIASAAPYYSLDGEVCGVVASFKDITDRKRAEEALARLATRDGLTGLFNRRRFDDALQQEWLRARRDRTPLSVVMSDVDHFKLFNDTYGHQAGDACLRQVAEALQSRVRRPADLAARYGGEEFVVLLPSTPREGALVVAEALRAAVVALGIPLARSTAGPVVTVSLGCATQAPGTDEPPAALLERADRALYEAKHAGRNRVEVE
jgi:diguanylate cyclase (GGDEF)-like protein/PAS domain S-box-containing protein